MNRLVCSSPAKTEQVVPPSPQHRMPLLPAFRRSQPRGGGVKKLVRNRGEDRGAVAEGRKVRPTSISHRHNLRPGASVELPSALPQCTPPPLAPRFPPPTTEPREHCSLL
ncbi:hypothetical protein HPB47_007377 [Ixodes persulcatus]|uniref:Uncharacterized protein n=1 Tax=Ixodes persulcatus TaxID=34615 RepID=A0AC60P7S6_IXOPE|nr:hypothetical protein HPB47_007377 [Ixodes persulcatus]